MAGWGCKQALTFFMPTDLSPYLAPGESGIPRIQHVEKPPLFVSLKYIDYVVYCLGYIGIMEKKWKLLY